MKLKHKIDKIIYEWVKENYGESEANNPSWSIVELANHIANKFHELYWQQELEYIKEDVEYYVENYTTDIKLTDKQMYAVADKIRNSEWYCSINPEDIEYYAREEMKKGE